MTDKQLHEVSTISQRFALTHTLANEAYQAINNLRYEAGNLFADDEEKEILKDAMQTLENIKAKTSHYSCIAYCKKELKEEIAQA